VTNACKLVSWSLGMAPVAAQRSPFDILALPRGADSCAVREAYHNLARQLHPDKVAAVSNSSGAERDRELRAASERFQEIQSAYEALLQRNNKLHSTQAQAAGRSRAAHLHRFSLTRSRSRSPMRSSPSPCSSKAELRRFFLLRRSGALRAEEETEGVALGCEGFRPGNHAEAKARLLRYRTRLEAARLTTSCTAECLDSVRGALWDLDRTGITIELLRETSIGVELNRAFWRQHAAEDVAEMCADLVMRWKAVLARKKSEKASSWRAPGGRH